MSEQIRLELLTERGGDFQVKLDVLEAGASQQRKNLRRGYLPANPKLLETFRQWQHHCRGLDDFPRALKRRDTTQITHGSDQETAIKLVRESADQLLLELNEWLSESDEFRPVYDRIMRAGRNFCFQLQTDQAWLQRLPWEKSSLLDNAGATFGLIVPEYDTLVREADESSKIRNSKSKSVKILAIMGEAKDLESLPKDKSVLQDILGDRADITWVQCRSRQDLNESLRKKAWDILFFSGHSQSSEDGKQFSFSLTEAESVSIGDFQNTLRAATLKGLSLAIFNSCDGVGLAHALAAQQDLVLPHTVFMREKLPDAIAPKFLKAFLEAFTQNKSLYHSVQYAQNILQDDWDQKFPCASWLPVFCPNPEEPELTWERLIQRVQNTRRSVDLKITLFSSLLIALGFIGIRGCGVLEPMELPAYDWTFQNRPIEQEDDRFVVVTVDQEDLDYQDTNGLKRAVIPTTGGKGSLSGEALSILLKRLDKASVVGLDILRPISATEDYPPLAQQLEASRNLVLVCSNAERKPLPPPPEIPLSQVGFSDIPIDTAEPNDIAMVRRYLYQAQFDDKSPCLSPAAIAQSRQDASGRRGCQLKDKAPSFGLLLVIRYLESQNKDLDCNALESGRVVASVGAADFNGWIDHTGPYRSDERREAQKAFQLMLTYRRSAKSPGGAVTNFARKIKLRDVLDLENGNFAPDMVTDKIVLIGVIKPGADDFYTPFSQSDFDSVPGVFLHAHAASQILANLESGRKFIVFLSFGAESFWMLVWSLAAGGLVWSLRGRPLWQQGVGGVVLCVLLHGFCVGFLFFFGVWLPWSSLGLMLLISMVLAWSQPSRLLMHMNQPFTRLFKSMLKQA